MQQVLCASTVGFAQDYLHRITWFVGVSWPNLGKEKAVVSITQGSSSEVYWFTRACRKLKTNNIACDFYKWNWFEFAVYGDTCPLAAFGGLIRHNTQQYAHSLPVVYPVSSASAMSLRAICLRACATSHHVGLPWCMCLISQESSISTMHCCGSDWYWPLMSSSMEGGRPNASPSSLYMEFTCFSWISRLSRLTLSSRGEGMIQIGCQRIECYVTWICTIYTLSPWDIYMNVHCMINEGMLPQIREFSEAIWELLFSLY